MGVPTFDRNTQFNAKKLFYCGPATGMFSHDPLCVQRVTWKSKEGELAASSWVAKRQMDFKNKQTFHQVTTLIWFVCSGINILSGQSGSLHSPCGTKSLLVHDIWPVSLTHREKVLKPTKTTYNSVISGLSCTVDTPRTTELRNISFWSQLFFFCSDWQIVDHLISLQLSRFYRISL